MPTPADQRLLEILEKWLKSLELHERYAGLDADSYARVQPWPEHERPSRWIIDLARQKTIALRTQLEARIQKGDAQFSEALELMAFLANLVGSEHIERFIPLATPENEQPLKRAAPVPASPAPPGAAPASAPPPNPGPSTQAPAHSAHPARGARGETASSPGAARGPAITPAPAGRGPFARPAPPPTIDTAPTREMPVAPIKRDLGELGSLLATGERPGVSVTATREMPRFAVPPPVPPPVPPRAAPAPPTPPQPSASGHLARERRAASVRSAGTAGRSGAKASAKHPAKMPAAAKPEAGSSAAGGKAGRLERDEAREQVAADAVRLLKWGRKWYELAELIARMADRPALPEVRRILKDNKTAIEKKAGRG